MQNCLFLLADWVNFNRGGVRLDNTERRRLEILSVDDASKTENVGMLYRVLIAGRIGRRTPDFLLGPYSSGLTEVAAKVANQNGHLLSSGTAAGARCAELSAFLYWSSGHVDDFGIARHSEFPPRFPGTRVPEFGAASLIRLKLLRVCE